MLVRGSTMADWARPWEAMSEPARTRTAKRKDGCMGWGGWVRRDARTEAPVLAADRGRAWLKVEFQPA